MSPPTIGFSKQDHLYGNSAFIYLGLAVRGNAPFHCRHAFGLSQDLHHHFHHIAIGLGLLCALPLCFFYGEEGFYSLAHTMVGEYVPFVILLWSLYTVAGGILVRGSIVGGPVSNSVMMLIGAVAASFVGTTGASMLLIRPILRANERRKYRAHTIVFFIFSRQQYRWCTDPAGRSTTLPGFSEWRAL